MHGYYSVTDTTDLFLIMANEIVILLFLKLFSELSCREHDKDRSITKCYHLIIFLLYYTFILGLDDPYYNYIQLLIIVNNIGSTQHISCLLFPELTMDILLPLAGGGGVTTGLSPWLRCWASLSVPL